jgi:hypothetical protein
VLRADDNGGVIRVRVSLAATLLLMLMTGSASGHPLSLVLSGHARNNTVVVRATGPDRGTYAINGSRPVAFARIRSLTINGHGGDDVCRIINPPHGLFAPPGGIACNGGNRPGATRHGVMDLSGGATSATAYLPGSIPGSGTLVTRRGKVRQRIRFSGLAPVTDTAPSLSETLNFNAPNDTVALVSGATAGTWTVESLDSPAAVESVTFSNKVQITVNAQGSDDVVLLENTGPETGMSSLTVNSSGPIIASGVEDAGIPVTLSSAGAIEGAGPAPNLATAQLTATGPTGIGPMSVSTRCSPRARLPARSISRTTSASMSAQ